MAPASECEMQAPPEGKRLGDPIQDWVNVVLRRRKHNLFLSHSGGQKNFVEQLCEDLERAEQSPFFDKRSDCLPKGEEFAQRIFTAAQECEMAIVVVSEKYFTRSKWPMQELVAIMQAPRCKLILPLFYGLSCNEFKNSKRRERWFQVWDAWSQLDSRICVDDWKDALRELDARNGMEYAKASGELAYRKTIVAAVCARMQHGSQYEIVAVEETDAYAAGEGLQQPGTGAVRLKRWFAHSQSTILIAILVALVTIIVVVPLLQYGFGHCPCAYKEIPYDHHILNNKNWLDLPTSLLHINDTNWLNLSSNNLPHINITNFNITNCMYAFGNLYEGRTPSLKFSDAVHNTNWTKRMYALGDPMYGSLHVLTLIHIPTMIGVSEL